MGEMGLSSEALAFHFAFLATHLSCVSPGLGGGNRKCKCMSLQLTEMLFLTLGDYEVTKGWGEGRSQR